MKFDMTSMKLADKQIMLHGQLVSKRHTHTPTSCWTDQTSLKLPDDSLAGNLSGVPVQSTVREISTFRGIRRFYPGQTDLLKLCTHRIILERSDPIQRCD